MKKAIFLIVLMAITTLAYADNAARIEELTKQQKQVFDKFQKNAKENEQLKELFTKNAGALEELKKQDEASNKDLQLLTKPTKEEKKK